MSEIFHLPPAYPDELWYSRLMRYHLHSGNMHLSTTLHELGIIQKTIENRYGYSLIYVTNPMMRYYAVRKDEKGFFEAMEHQTLEPFVLRYYPKNSKINLMKNISLKIRNPRPRVVDFSSSVSKRDYFSFAYCPICREADLKEFGETYWHRLHQIPLMSVCPIHHCRLLIEQTSRQTTTWLPFPSCRPEPHFRG